MTTEIFPPWVPWAAVILTVGSTASGIYWAVRSRQGIIEQAQGAAKEEAKALRAELVAADSGLRAILDKQADKQDAQMLLLTEVKTRLIGLNGQNGLVGDLKAAELEQVDIRKEIQAGYRELRTELTKVVVTAVGDLAEKIGDIEDRVKYLERKPL